MNRAIGDSSPLFIKMIMNSHIRWPLFYCLSPEEQVKLMQYQWDNYGYRLEIPAPSPEPTEPTYPSLEEIDKEMRKPPERQKRVT